MAQPGSTWQQLLQAIFNDFQRLDLLTQPTPLPSDTIWVYAQEAIAYFQPDIFVQSEAYLQWASTFRYQKYYALPTDFETDGQILANIFGLNSPLSKRSQFEINQMDVQIPAVIGAPEFYTLYGTPLAIYGSVTNVWQANFDYTSAFQGSQGPGQLPYLIKDSNGNIQQLSNATGLSGATQPTWPTTIGTAMTDNNVTWVTWFNMSNPSGIVMRLFPTPDNVYLLTASYNNVIPMPVNLTDSNFWTVQGEAMVRHYTEFLIRQNVTHEAPPVYQADYNQTLMEFNKLSGIVRKQTGVGHARPVYL